ncbi:MAG: alpha/beta hydrolase, partial [Planctomycetota bacterium]
HGAAQDHTIWVLPRRYFVRHGYNVLDLDLPGHGYSAGPALTTVEAMADWVMQGLDARGVAPVALVGHSLGSLIALDAAARYPASVSQIALVGTAVPMPVGEVLMEAAQHHPQDAFEMMNTWSHSDAAQMGGSATPGMWMMGTGLRLFERSQPGVVHTDLQACHNYAAGLERAKKVACPALLILGQRDMMTPAKAAQPLATALPDATQVKLAGCGHALLAERPEEVLDALANFL